MRQIGILGGRLWVSRSNHHVTVILITPLTLTTVGNITGRMVLGRVIKLSGHASIRAGLALPASRRCRRSRHALTFHRRNFLLNTAAEPRRANRGSPGLLGRGATSLIAWHAEFIPSVRQSHRA